MRWSMKELSKGNYKYKQNTFYSKAVRALTLLHKGHLFDHSGH